MIWDIVKRIFLKKIIVLTIILFSFPLSAESEFWFQQGYQFNQSSDVDNQSLIFTDTFIGISIGHYFVFGQNIIYSTRTNTKESTDYSKGDYSILELGPRFTLFFNEERNLSLSINYNPYCKGVRKKTGSVKQDVDGSSININLGLQLSFTEKIYLGASLNYHKIMLTTGKVSGTETSIGDDYSYFFPAIEFSFRI